MKYLKLFENFSTSKKIEKIKDSTGQDYLAIKIEKSEINNFLTQLKDVIGEDYELYTNNQQNRDNNSNHITVISVMDWGRLNKSGKASEVESLISDLTIDDVEMLGLGMAESKGNKAYFVVCESKKLDDLRNQFGLGKQDFHITLGFDKKDVFGVAKNRQSLIKN